MISHYNGVHSDGDLGGTTASCVVAPSSAPLLVLPVPPPAVSAARALLVLAPVTPRCSCRSGGSALRAGTM